MFVHFVQSIIVYLILKSVSVINDIAVYVLIYMLNNLISVIGTLKMYCESPAHRQAIYD